MSSQHSHPMSRRNFLGTGAGAVGGAVLLASAARAAAQEPDWTPSTDKKMRIGVVGGGFGASFHWHEHPNCIVQAVSDLIPERRDRLMEKYQCAKSYESLEKLILDPEIDAVAVFTPAPDHARHVIACMEAGKHVISACPACMTLEEAAQMKEVKERTERKYMQAETSYFRWETITARELMTKGELGDLVYTEAEYYHPMTESSRQDLWFRDGKRTWRYGFPPMVYPTHSTAFLVGVTKERLTKVSCIGAGDPADQGLKDNVYNNPFDIGMALFLTDKGNPFRCNVAWRIHAHGERAQWFGTKGALYMAASGGRPYALDLPDRTVNETPDYWHRIPETMRYDSGHGRSHSFITNEFVMAVAEDREPAIDIYEALAFCVPGIVAHQSSLKSGEQLVIPSFDRV